MCIKRDIEIINKRPQTTAKSANNLELVGLFQTFEQVWNKMFTQPQPDNLVDIIRLVAKWLYYKSDAVMSPARFKKTCCNLMKLTSFLQLFDNLEQPVKTDNLQQICGVFFV